MRKIEIDGQIWEFMLGRSNAVIKSPDGKKTIVSFSDLTGRTSDVIQRGQFKKTSDGMVKPGHVRGFIIQHLLKTSRI